MVSGGNGQWVEPKLSEGAFHQEALYKSSPVRIQYCVRGLKFGEGHCEGGMWRGGKGMCGIVG